MIKYNKFNIKSKESRTFKGIVFDSAMEKNRYIELLMLEKAGHISNLETQPRFLLIPPFDYHGEHFRPVHYTADFRYFDKEKEIEIIEEVKSSYSSKEKDYVIRKKLFLSKYPDIVFFENIM